MEEKKEDSNPGLKIVSLVSDAVHVGKSKRQGFSNWFLWVEGSGTIQVYIHSCRN